MTTYNATERLERLTTTTLRGLATACALTGRSKMVKAALVAALATVYTTAEALGPELEDLQLKALAKPRRQVTSTMSPQAAVYYREVEVAKQLEAAYFPSGSNRPAEILGLVDAGANVGVSVTELSGPAERTLLELAGQDVEVFVDSGAFSEVDFNDDGPYVVAEITDADWRRRLATMRRLAVALGDQLHPVAPDKVAYQADTLDRLERYAGEVRELHELGAQVMVAHQKGELTLAEFNRQVVELLGFDFTVAVPMKKDATSVDELVEFVAEVKPARLHLLGLGVKADAWRPTVAAILAASPSTKVQGDSVLVGALVGRTNGPGGGRRALTIAQDDRLEQVAASMWAEGVDGLDYTDFIAEPSCWISKAGKARLVAELEASGFEPEGDLDEWLGDNCNDWTAAVVDTFWRQYMLGTGTSLWRRRNAVADTMRNPAAVPVEALRNTQGEDHASQTDQVPQAARGRHTGAGRPYRRSHRRAAQLQQYGTCTRPGRPRARAAASRRPGQENLTGAAELMYNGANAQPLQNLSW